MKTRFEFVELFSRDDIMVEQRNSSNDYSLVPIEPCIRQIERTSKKDFMTCDLQSRMATGSSEKAACETNKNCYIHEHIGKVFSFVYLHIRPTMIYVSFTTLTVSYRP